ncbi:MAG: FtsX-like permease family protein [Methanomassiliicoccales archaeon]|nr:FtsX-like permease family protein [Methanomassiliicoccales archaeon]
MLIILIASLRPSIFIRMGLHNITRRKAHTALVIGALMIATAMISSSLVTSDSLDFYIRETSYLNSDLMDEYISSPGGGFFDFGVYNGISQDQEIRALTDGISPQIMFQGISVFNPRTGLTSPSSTVVGFDSALDQEFGEFAIPSGDRYGEDLGDDEIIINSMLSERIGAQVGDSLEVYYIIPPSLDGIPEINGIIPTLPGRQTPSEEETSMQEGMAEIRSIQFNVKSISSDAGKAAMFGTPNLFLKIESAWEMYQTNDFEYNFIKVSNNGGMIDSVVLTDQVTTEIERVLDNFIENDPLNAVLGSLVITDYKRNQLDLADFAAENFGDFLLLMSMFAVTAGVILIVNIFVMLAEERKRELGISRAIGLKRIHLTRIFTFEGLGYTFPASIIGALLGILIAYMLITSMNSIMGVEGGESLPFYFFLSSLVLSIVLGTLVSIATILLVSRKISKLNIVRAIREIEEPVLKKGTNTTIGYGLFLAILGNLITYVYYFHYDYYLLLITGSILVIAGAAMIVRREVRPEIVYSIAGVLIFLYALWTLFNVTYEGTDAILAFVFIGLILCFSAVVILVFNSRIIVSGVSRLFSFSPSSKAISQIAVGYSLQKRFRTGMTIAMFTLVLFLVTMTSIFTSSFVVSDITEEAGGYDIVSTTSLSVENLENVTVIREGEVEEIDSEVIRNDVEYIESIRIFYFMGNLQKNGEDVPSYGPPYYGIFGIEDDFKDHTKWNLESIHPEYSTEDEVWAALQEDDSLVIISSGTASTHIPILVGDIVTLPSHVVDSSVELRVIGIVKETLLNGLFIAKSSMGTIFPHLIDNNLFLVNLKDGVLLESSVEKMNTDFRSIGMEAQSIEKVLIDSKKQMEDIMQMFSIFLSLGLLIGVASLGVLAYRAVFERKRIIGMLRSIGYQRSMISKSFLVEVLFITSLGVLLGIFVGFTCAYGIWYTAMAELDVPFVFPWETLLIIVGIVYLAAILCTVAPSRMASRIPPAEAFRDMG